MNVRSSRLSAQNLVWVISDLKHGAQVQTGVRSETDDDTVD